MPMRPNCATRRNDHASWLSKSRAELDEIYCNSSPGSIPQGDTTGTAILAGSSLTRLVAKIVYALAWRGKFFDMYSADHQAGILHNKISPFSLRMIIAKVYRQNSWMDNKETIVIDYSRTSLLAKAIRDEIREIEPGVYLGKVWLGKKRVLDFALVRSNT